MAEKVKDLAGPGIGDYGELAKELPQDYESLLAPMDRMKAVFAVKHYIEENLCQALNLQMVQVPLIVDKDSGVNDYLDRDGSRTPVEFDCGLGLDNPIRAQVVQAATKWKRMALQQFGCKIGEGICTDMRAVRKDYFLDHDHSAYVDQWDWELVITEEERTLDFLKEIVTKIWKVIWGAGNMAQEMFPQLKTTKYPDIPEELTFLHAEEILDRYPDLPRKQRETRILQDEAPAIFIIGIGWPLKDGYPHEMRAADYDDWATETVSSKRRAVSWVKRRYLGVESRDKTTPRADVDGHSGHQGDAQNPTQDVRPGGFPQSPLPSGHSQRSNSTEHWRRHRAGQNLHVPVAHRPSWRGHRFRVAKGAQGYLREEQHSRTRMKGKSL